MQELKVGENEENYRLDKFILKKFPELSFKNIQKLVRIKKIKVNNTRCDCAYRIKINDLVQIFISKEFDHQSTKQKKTIYNLDKNFYNYIIFEDENIIALNKPPKLAVQGGSGIKISIDDMIQEINENYRLVHRIDKETSGILIIAKNLKTARELTYLFKNRKIEKIYISLNEGIIEKSSGIITHNIIINDESLESITEYKVIKYIKNMTLTQFMPHTGRKHQIRIHSAQIGHPIIGDKKYNNKIDKNNNYLLLHAREIKFALNKENYNIKCDIPDYFQEFINKI